MAASTCLCRWIMSCSHRRRRRDTARSFCPPSSPVFNSTVRLLATAADCRRLNARRPTRRDSAVRPGELCTQHLQYPLCTTTTAGSTCRLLHTSFAVADQSCVPTPSAPADAEPFPRRGLEPFYKCAGVMTRCAAISARRLN